MTDFDVPVLAWPIRVAGDGSFAAVEQDSDEDVMQCVEIICSTGKGWREELPTFGITDPTFQQGVDLQDISQALASWEPRATVNLDVTIDSGDELIKHIKVQVATGDDDDDLN